MHVDDVSAKTRNAALVRLEVVERLTKKKLRETKDDIYKLVREILAVESSKHTKLVKQIDVLLSELPAGHDTRYIKIRTDHVLAVLLSCTFALHVCSVQLRAALAILVPCMVALYMLYHRACYMLYHRACTRCTIEQRLS